MILITGAAGFIGSKVAQKFIELGNETITIDNLSTGKKENIPKETILLQGSCGDPDVIKQLESYTLEGIIHIAGQSSGEVSFENPAYDLESNTMSTVLLLDFARRKGIKRFVFASTMSVYGDATTLPVTENSALNPKSFYACGKLASESYLNIYSKNNIECIGLRLFNVYGPGQNLDNLQQGMLSIFLAQALKSSSIVVKGSSNRFRDFVYIDDVVEAFRLLYFSTYSGFKLYNICSGKPTKVIDLVNNILEKLEIDIPVIYEGNTPGDQFGIYGSSKALFRDHGWEPTISFDKGLEETVKWAKK